MCEEIKFNTSELFKINDLNQFKEILEISIVFFQGTHLGQKPCNGAFTLPNTETEIDTDSYKMGTKLKGNLCSYLSLYSRNTSHNSMQAIFIGLRTILGVGQCKLTINHWEKNR